MTFKAGDPIQIEFKLGSLFGHPPVYGTPEAMVLAGWALEWWQDSALLATSPDVIEFAAHPSSDGTHFMTITAPQGVTTFKPVPPAGRKDWFSVADVTIIVPVNDTDSLAASINSATGTIVAGGIATQVSDINFTEGDSFQVQFTIPTSALKVFDNTNKLIYQFDDLADIGGQPWTIAAQARYLTEGGQLPTQSVAFSFEAQVLDKDESVVGIGWITAPAAAVIDDVLPTAPTVTVADGAITGTTGGTGGHVYGSNPVTVSLSGGGGTGGTLTATVVNGVITGYVVTAAGSGYATAPTATLAVESDGEVLSRTFRLDIQLRPPVGSDYANAKLTVVAGNFIINRQQTTTP